MIELFLDVAEQSLVARDDDVGCPPARFCAEQLELERKKSRVTLSCVDVGVHALHEGPHDRRAVWVVHRQLRGEVAAILEQPRADVALELAFAEQLRDGSGRLPSPELELKEPVARGRITLREEKVVLVFGVDVRDAAAITDDLDRRTKPGSVERVAGHRSGEQRGQNRQAEKRCHAGPYRYPGC